MYWIVAVIEGAVVGWLASILMKTNAQMGAIANIVVGIVGSSLGFWLAGLLGLSTSGPIVGWVVAVLGAALLIFILKAVGIFQSPVGGLSRPAGNSSVAVSDLVLPLRLLAPNGVRGVGLAVDRHG